RMVMAHELTHALEDQHFHIEAWSRAARPNEDAELARDAVLEGSAMAAMMDYLMLGTGRSLKDLPEFDPSMPIGELESTPTLKTPPLEKMLGKDWAKLDENILGEFGWKEVVKQFLDDDRAKSLAATWDGDRYALYEQKQTKKLILVTRLHLDSEEHAARFFGQYSEALEKKHSERVNLLRRPSFFSFETPDGAVFLYCLGRECVTMEGSTRDVFDDFTKALDWPLAPQPPERPRTVPEKTAQFF